MFVAIIQARIGSSRLAGKVLKEVVGKPLIQHQIERVCASQKISKIILATTENPEDDELVEFALSNGHDVFRGSEDDVLSRYYFAYKQIVEELDQIKGVVRITGDCPLFDPYICDQLLEFYEKEHLDHAYLSEKFAEGLDCDVFHPKVLEKAFQHANLQFEREHITQYFKKIEGIKVATLDNTYDDSDIRITVDEKEDLEVVTLIFEALYGDKNFLKFETIRNFLNKNLEIKEMNSQIKRNEGLDISIKNESLKK